MDQSGFCRICPLKCEFVNHIHVFEERKLVLDEKQMDELRMKIEKELKTCTRKLFNNLDMNLNKISKPLIVKF